MAVRIRGTCMGRRRASAYQRLVMQPRRQASPLAFPPQPSIIPALIPLSLPTKSHPGTGRYAPSFLSAGHSVDSFDIQLDLLVLGSPRLPDVARCVRLDVQRHSSKPMSLSHLPLWPMIARFPARAGPHQSLLITSSSTIRLHGRMVIYPQNPRFVATFS